MALPDPRRISNVISRSGMSFRLDQAKPQQTGAGFQFVIQIQNGTSTNLDGLLFVISLQNEAVGNSEDRFRVAKAPEHGKLMLVTSPEDQLESFTRQDVQTNSLVYQHDGSPTKSDQFTIELLDKSSDPAEAFQIMMTPLVLGPVLINNESAVVPAGRQVVITGTHLETVAASADADDLIYTVSAPKHGRLVRLIDDPIEVTSFSQLQINEQVIAYQHQGTEAGIDQFEFDVFDPESRQLGIAVFKILIEAS